MTVIKYRSLSYTKGDRRFTKENIEQLLIIHDLVKQRGFTLEGAKLEIKTTRKRLVTRQQIITRLQHLRNELEQALR